MTTQRFPLPDVGEGLTEAEIVEWRVAVGDTVAVNQVIVEIESAKSLVELPSPWAGTVSALLAEEGTTVDVGTAIIEITTDAEVPGTSEPTYYGSGEASGEASGEGSGSVLVGYGTGDGEGSGRRRRRAAAPSAKPVQTTPPSVEPVVTAPSPVEPAVTAPSSAEPVETANRVSTGSTGGPAIEKPMASVPATSSAGAQSTRVLAKPPVRKLAKDLGVDLASVHPTGPGGIVTREDVVAHHEGAAPKSLATYPDDDRPWLASGTVSQDGRQTRVPVKSVRKRTAEAMVASAFTAPHVTVFQTIDVTKTMRLVARLKEDRDFADVRVTPLLIAAKAMLLAVNRHPQINASWDEAAQEIVYKHYVNLGIAAATPRGLVVPNIKGAHTLDLLGLAKAIATLTSTARAGRTQPADMADGSITITNVGIFGTDTGTPILNPGEAGILAFGAIRKQPWVHKGKIKSRWVTQLALSVDHRLVDGELAARYLADVAKVLEDPARGLVWG
ncbi:dihydrolipoamide acetyltransferase family protein [Krasilnikoviella flava]|uniref:Dihydrolipoamide acetyltransferase component of pyruvate dehydrogenase complex n=1 Tax=Krasilnikoviella flava TaxID=526729 RepID=A0A1T5LXR4_9MICO|nr:dihydrolipoamide acetyltransferase family protein [Krasilnikoviella flava]SKC80655.1 pyruvate dehydrogenase E2 component (dihydrolipoamide acetyltransferase) [Krasilnikoviella flava]